MGFDVAVVPAQVLKVNVLAFVNIGATMLVPLALTDPGIVLVNCRVNSKLSGTLK